MKYYKITWKDHFAGSEWKNKQEIEEWAKKRYIKPCTTIGELTYENNDMIVLSATFDGEESYSEHMVILKKYIVNKKLLKNI